MQFSCQMNQTSLCKVSVKIFKIRVPFRGSSSIFPLDYGINSFLKMSRKQMNIFCVLKQPVQHKEGLKRIFCIMKVFSANLPTFFCLFHRSKSENHCVFFLPFSTKNNLKNDKKVMKRKSQILLVHVLDKIQAQWQCAVLCN